MSDNLPAPIPPEFPPKSEFRKWLRSLPPDEVVAHNWTCHDCPLAMWLHKARSINEPYINPGYGYPAPFGLWGENGAGDFPLPEWADAFGTAIDNLGDKSRPDSLSTTGPVTAADCLAVLRRTPRE